MEFVIYEISPKKKFVPRLINIAIPDAASRTIGSSHDSEVMSNIATTRQSEIARITHKNYKSHSIKLKQNATAYLSALPPIHHFR